MQAKFNDDIVWLKEFVFSKTKAIEEMVLRYQAAKVQIDQHPDAKLIWNIYRWLLTPYSLWPIELDFIAEFALMAAEERKRMPKRIKFVLEVIAAAPSRSSVRAILEFEKEVKNGTYEVFLKQPQKYQEISEELVSDQALFNTWKRLKSLFPLEKRKNKTGVIRRTLRCERNVRHDHGKPNSRDARFYDAFDVMCHRWQLYGMEHDKPLPLKVTVNPTPHGIMIMIPRLWSLDVKRDIDWKLLQRLHHCYGAKRQGPRLSAARAEIRQEARAIANNWTIAEKNGIRGEKRYALLRQQMKKHPRTDESFFKRRLKQADRSRVVEFP